MLLGQALQVTDIFFFFTICVRLCVCLYLLKYKPKDIIVIPVKTKPSIIKNFTIILSLLLKKLFKRRSHFNYKSTLSSYYHINGQMFF